MSEPLQAPHVSNLAAGPSQIVPMTPVACGSLGSQQPPAVEASAGADIKLSPHAPGDVPACDVPVGGSSQGHVDECKPAVSVRKPTEAIVLHVETESKLRAARFPVWMRFLPAMVVWPVWMFAVAKGDNNFADVFQYWPATLAMVFGSFIAGSTPLGGGVVAFPLSVLVLKFTAEESRDAAALVQSIGMTSAAFLLFICKPHLLHAHIMAVSCVGGVLGIILALEVEAPPRIINFTYTVTVLAFGLVYWYTNYISAVTAAALAAAGVNAPPRKQSTELASSPHLTAPAHVVLATPALTGDAADAMAAAATSPHRSSSGVLQPPVGPLGNGILRDRVVNVVLFTSAILGGFITGNVGSGSDMILYVFGVYVWNVLCPEKRLSDTAFTASSVVVMGAMSVVTAAARGFTAGFTPKVVECWGAMAFVVCVGAPVGSMVLTPAAVPYLRLLFYTLAVVQFAMFAALKIQGDTAAWGAVAIIVGVEVTGIVAHYRHHAAKLAKRIKSNIVGAPAAASSVAV